MSIPNTSFTLQTPIGTIAFDLNDGAFTTFYIGDVDLGFSDGIGITAKATDLEIRLTFQWDFKQKSFPYMSDGGELDVSISDAYFYLIVNVTAGDDGLQTLKVVEDEFNISSLSIVMHGNMEELYSAIIGAMTDSLTYLLESTVEAALQMTLETMVNAAIRNGPTCKQVVNGDVTSGLDERLVSDPVFTAQYMSMPYSYVWVQSNTPLYTRQYENNIPDVVGSNGLQRIYDLDYVDSLIWIFYYQDVFSYQGDIQSSSLEVLVASGQEIEGMCFTDDDSCQSRLSWNALELPQSSLIASAVELAFSGSISIDQKASTDSEWTTVVSANASIVFVTFPVYSQDSNAIFFDFDIYTCSIDEVLVGAGTVNPLGLQLVYLLFTSAQFVPALSSFASQFCIENIVIGNGYMCNEVAFYGDNYVALIGDVCINSVSLDSDPNQYPYSSSVISSTDSSNSSTICSDFLG
eukprot:gnl/Carplike_NY0171/5700_a7812_226.p1 GENE.gnl/Carplike_NY0171/5700_a7812_226~~gnl/Carplike_NY0171/5700_a7812_226.p1  ORF type:complete len:532 (+),score=123.13 gnl/Carplike_NY0171/5700_a7812_226:208-1596(+)